MTLKTLKTETNAGDYLFCFGDNDSDTGGGGGGDDSGGADNDTQVAEATEILQRPGNESLAHDDIKKLLNFDPVTAMAAQKAAKKAEAKEETPAKSKPVSQKAAPGKAPAKPGAKVAAPATPTPEQKPALDPNVAAVVQTVGQLAKNQQQLQQQQQQKTQSEGDKPWYGGITEALEIDARVMDLLDSENPQERIHAMQGIVNGTANQVMKDTMNYVHQTVIPNIMKAAQQQAQETFQRLKFEDLMTNKHPVFKDANLRNVVNTFGNQLIQSKQAANQSFDFNEEFLDELLPMVLTYIQSTTGIDPSQQQLPVVKPTPRPHIPPQNARPPAGSESFSESADFLDAVGMGHLRPRQVN